MDSEQLALARRVFSCIDNTSLASTDSKSSIEAFCRRTKAMTLADGTTVAAVCVYPRFVDVAVRELAGSGIRVATVAGAFPHGQLPLELKVDEVRRAVDEGADEVDIVINRGLEICDLPSPILVEHASRVAIEAGADFIKTSTGKGTSGATLEGAEEMLITINDYVKICKKEVGFKAAGGIRKPEEALEYARLAQKIMGEQYIKKETFRIGASSLTEGLFSILTF